MQSCLSFNFLIVEEDLVLGVTSIVLLKWFVVFTIAIDPNCDYYQDVVPGQEYFIFNQEYPNMYGPFTSCRWNARSPPGTVIVLTCDDVHIPDASNPFVLDHNKTFSFSLSIAKQTDFPFRPREIKVLGILEATAEIIL